LGNTPIFFVFLAVLWGKIRLEIMDTHGRVLEKTAKNGEKCGIFEKTYKK